MNKRLSFIAFLSLLSLNLTTSPLIAVTVLSGAETPTAITTEDDQEEAVYGPQRNPEHQDALNNNNQIDDEDHNQIDLQIEDQIQIEDQFSEEENNTFIEFSNDNDIEYKKEQILNLLKKQCTTEYINGRTYRYTPQKRQKELLKSLRKLINSRTNVKLIFSKATKLDNGVAQATYNIQIENNLLKNDVVLIDVTYHYPTFSNKKCVFVSPTDYLLSNGCEHGNYVYSLKKGSDKNTIALLNNNNADFQLIVGTDLKDGFYTNDVRDAYLSPNYSVWGQLYIDNKKSCVIKFKATMK